MLFPVWLCDFLGGHVIFSSYMISLGGYVISSVVLIFSRDFLGGSIIFPSVYWVHRWLYDLLGCYTGFLGAYMSFIDRYMGFFGRSIDFVVGYG